MSDHLAHLDRFRQHAFRAILSLLEHGAQSAGGIDKLLEAHPFLSAYLDEASQLGFEGLSLQESISRWDRGLADWDGPPHALDRLAQSTGLDANGITGWLWCGLCREDPRFASVLHSLLGRDGSPTRATLSPWMGEKSSLSRLVMEGWLEEIEAGHDHVFRIPQCLWEAVRGQDPGIAGARWERHPSGSIDPIFPESVWKEAGSVSDGRNLTWILQGNLSSGRTTLARWLALREGKGLLRLEHVHAQAKWAGPLSVLLDAMPLWSLDAVAGERLDWSPPAAIVGPCILRVSGNGSVRTHNPSRRVALGAPDRIERIAHWHRAIGKEPDPSIRDLRIARGAIHSLAPELGPDGNRLDGFRHEWEARGRHLLEGIAKRLPAPGDHDGLELSLESRKEFQALISRCKHRERLAETLPASFGHGGTGVRALFKGPSGTGKTLGARHLAHALGRPVYRLDLSSVVSKWIGETEKNLEKAFQGAEALDVVLLLDEGDALLGQRTSVGSSTDRYANLETNYLLQRIESFDGILVTTTNAFDRIDSAFLRRFDAVVDFPLPEPNVRLNLWTRHLPGDHVVPLSRLEEVASKCLLAGGSIRNATLHATLLSLETNTPVDDALFVEALRREYRRASQTCPALGDIRE
ncbi:MAG: family ATPase [Fibrobacterota bacterium]|jgi:hypothetical protein